MRWSILFSVNRGNTGYIVIVIQLKPWFSVFDGTPNMLRVFRKFVTDVWPGKLPTVSFTSEVCSNSQKNMVFGFWYSDVMWKKPTKIKEEYKYKRAMYQGHPLAVSPRCRKPTMSQCWYLFLLSYPWIKYCISSMCFVLTSHLIRK